MVDTSMAFVPVSRYCPTTKMSGWLELRYVPLQPRPPLVSTASDSTLSLARRAVESQKRAADEDVRVWATRLAGDLAKITD